MAHVSHARPHRLPCVLHPRPLPSLPPSGTTTLKSAHWCHTHGRTAHHLYYTTPTHTTNHQPPATRNHDTIRAASKPRTAAPGAPPNWRCATLSSSPAAHAAAAPHRSQSCGFASPDLTTAVRPTPQCKPPMPCPAPCASPQPVVHRGASLHRRPLLPHPAPTPSPAPPLTPVSSASWRPPTSQLP